MKVLAMKTRDRIVELVRSGCSVEDAAEFLELPLAAIERACYMGKARKAVLPGNEYTPTPEQIRVACEEIQATWSEQETRSRLGLRRWSVDSVETQQVTFLWTPASDRGTKE